MKQPILVTKRLSPKFVWLFLLGLLFIFCCYVFASIPALTYKGDVFRFSMSAFSGLSAILIISLITSSQKTYKIYSDRILVSSIFGFEIANIPIQEIKSWTESSQITKNGGTYFILILYTRDKKVRLNSSFMRNEEYLALKKLITKTKQEDIHLELINKISKSKAILIVCVILTILLVFFYVGFYNKINSNKQSNKIEFGFCASIFSFGLSIFSSLRTIRNSKEELEELNNSAKNF